MASLRELGEAEVLRRLEAERGAATGVALGPGDDAALLEPAPGAAIVATTDAIVEGVHYLPEWTTPTAIGARLAAVNLSDMAAMAARPRWALLSIGARPESSADLLVEVQRGAQAMLGRFDAGIVGGNLTSVSGAPWWSLTLLGEVSEGEAWRRAGARSGDRIAVTGYPGRAGAGLALARRLNPRERTAEWDALLAAWLEPEPRVALALALAETGAVRAAIDLSDGLAGDLAKLCEASAVGAELTAQGFTDDADLERAARTLKVDATTLRLGPSDDYELLMAIDPDGADGCQTVAEALGIPLAFIGQFTADRNSRMLVDGTGKPRPIVELGYDPFAKGDA